MPHSFRNIKRLLVNSSILAYPNFQEHFSLYTDASSSGTFSNFNGIQETIAFASGSL